MTNDSQIKAIAKRLHEANRLLFITGAGVSVDSGLPTYRGIGGLYEGTVTEDGITIEDALSHAMLIEEPEITWKYLWEITRVCRGAQPNRCHEILAQIGQRIDETWILTQNVDGLHLASGSRHVIEIHGRADQLQCMACGNEEKGSELMARRALDDISVPRCRVCDGVLRPSVVLFGESLPQKAMHDLEELARTGVDMVVSLGTSSLFPYIVAPMQLAHQLGIPTVEINLQETEATPFANDVLRLGCTEALEKIYQELNRLS